MQPICPACRAPISLEASLCGRCGLAVRPTCPSCGEPLQAGDESCSRCGVALDDVAFAAPPPPPAPPAPPPPTSMAVEVLERARHESVPLASPKPRRKRGRVLLQLVVIAVVAGVLVAGAMLALQLVAPRPASPAVTGR